MEQQANGGLNIYQRLRAVMGDVVGVGKHEENRHGGYAYAGHEAVTAALRGAYVKHGIHRSATVLEDDRNGGFLRLRVEVKWTNVDNPDDFHAVTVIGESPPVTKSGAPSPVQSGIAFSYAVKNAEFKVFALTGDDTPDAEEDDGRETGRQRSGGGKSSRPQNSSRPNESRPKTAKGGEVLKGIEGPLRAYADAKTMRNVEQADSVVAALNLEESQKVPLRRARKEAVARINAEPSEGAA